MNVTEKFLKYIKYDTRSNEESESFPSTAAQTEFAALLCEELLKLGVKDAMVDDYSYVYAHIPASHGFESVPPIGFIAHMDTSPDYSSSNVSPNIIKNYDGGDIELGDSGIILKTSQYPHLLTLKGRTLITTDGKSLLGADDKAGIAIIMTSIQKIISDIPHGKICVCFTPDEETGRGTDFFDPKKFGAAFAFTIDGGYEGEIEYDNFNAYEAVFSIQGRSIHPGNAKGIMKNASSIACELNSLLPSTEVPEFTEGHEGFYHLCRLNGSVDCATVKYLVRDHDSNNINFRLSLLRHIEKYLNEKYGNGTVSLILTEQYRNMKDIILKNRHLVSTAEQAISSLGLTPRSNPVRGGTDGARISYMGIPCPNLGTGGYAFHGPYEHITSEGMEHVVNIVCGIVERYASSID